MKLKIVLPTGQLYDNEIRKVSAEAIDGAFTMLPRHIDFVTCLVPSLLYCETEGKKSEEVFFAVDAGILIKQGPTVLVSTRNAVKGADLETLRKTIHEHFEVLDEHERQARSALNRMEADFVQRFLELEGEL